MDTSKISVDSGHEKNKKKRLARSSNPVWAITWRVLLICAIIDIPVWAYFHFVKGVSFWEGIIQMRSGVHRETKRSLSTEQRHLRLTEIEKEEAKRKHLEKILEKVKQQTIAEATKR